jgi:hypothetical protein
MLALVARTELYVADRNLVERAIMLLEPEAAMASGAAMDALVMTALGWEVRAEPRVRQPAWRCRSPRATHWIAVPAVSANATACAEFVVPWRWDHGCGVRQGKPYGFVRRDDATWFDTSGNTPARALLKASLHGHRALLLERENHHA